MCHPDRGTFRIFVSEVGRPAGNRRYEAVVDRSIGVAPSKRAVLRRSGHAVRAPPATHVVTGLRCGR